MSETHDTGDEAAQLRGVFGAERAKAFVDAVVAIAMTLLILPLMESVARAGAGEGGAGHWLDAHRWQLISFLISFALIAMFWAVHHRLFARVHRVSQALLWITMVWLLTIVWLPVATALIGVVSDTDALTKILYMGSMILTCVITFTQRLYLEAHPALHEIGPVDLRRGMAADLAMALLFAIALAVAILVPAIGYLALLLMYLTALVQRVFARMLGVGRAGA